ncbi:MAG: ribonuclease III [Alphaproteobacteria bacterium]|nr:ribonuclease III [Alphaproteobacteria bacterium]
MEKLQKILQYRFRNQKLLQQALTHSSITGNEHRNYERLEFLGDRVLGMTMAHLLYKMFPHEREGVLAQRHVKLVRAETVAVVVKKLHIDEYIIAKDKETAQGTNVLCDVGEAIIGAIYIDSNIEQAIAFVERNWRDMIDTAESGSAKDFKTRLQEKFHTLKQPFPVYEVVSKVGSEHEPIFTVRVALDNKVYAIGQGKNKKVAEQQAAEKLLKILENGND